MTPPRASVSEPAAAKAVYLGEQTLIPSHVANVPGLGDVLFHHAIGVNVAEVELNDGAPRIALQLATPPCDCGCGARGRGLVLTPGVEEARIIAGQLLSMANEHEAAAKRQAAAVIRKVAGK